MSDERELQDGLLLDYLAHAQHNLQVQEYSTCSMVKRGWPLNHPVSGQPFALSSKQCGTVQ